MDASRTFAARKIRWMLQKGLLEPVEYGEDFPALFLTTLGIETYRYLFNIPKEIMDLESIPKLTMNTNELTPDNHRAGKLKQSHVIGSFLFIGRVHITVEQ